MSVAALSSTELDKLFLEYIDEGYTNQVEASTILVNRFKTDTKSLVAQGKYAVFKNIYKSPASARPSSSSTFPTAIQETWSDFTLYMKRGLYDTMQFDGLAMACAQGDKGSVLDIVEAGLESHVFHHANKLNRQFWGDGSGRLAQLSAASSNSTTVTIDGALFGQDSNEYTNPAQYLDEGMPVDIYHTSSGTKEADNIAISSITDNEDGTATLTMASAVTATNNAYVFDVDTYASSEAAGTGVPNGIRVMVDSSAGYAGVTAVDFQGVARGTYDYAQANVINHASAALTNDVMMRMCFLCEKWGKLSVIITNPIIWRAYFAILEQDKTMPNEKAYWGGTTGLAFYGGRGGSIPIIWDWDCPDNDMYFLNDGTINVYAPTTNGLDWVRGTDGKGILRMLEGKDELAAHIKWYYNFGTKLPKSNGRIRAIKHASS